MEKTIVIADDHPLLRRATAQQIRQSVPQSHCAEVESIEALQAWLTHHKRADLILLDLSMPGAYGFSGLIYLKKNYPDIPVAIFTAADGTENCQQAMTHQASGFLSKTLAPALFQQAINELLQGKSWWPENIAHHATERNDSHQLMEQNIASLTPQQFRVMGMIGEGLLNKQIAYALTISEATVKAHVTAIFKKLGVRNRTQIVIAIKSLALNKQP